MINKFHFALLLAAFSLFGACKKSDTAETPPSTAVNSVALPGLLTITGDATAASGARWSYTEAGTVNYNLEGVLYKPTGSGPFPAILINHGTGGSSLSYSSSVARQMVKWGYVCIAPNYTHASTTVPCGSPGSCDETIGEWGASNSNLLRAIKTRQILVSLSYVDSAKLASFGHSRGAFLTTYIAALSPNSFKAYGHTAGGVNTGTEPSATTAAGITRPYLLHHGDADNVVPPERDISLRNILQANAVTHAYYSYAGYSHQDITLDSMMLIRTRQWFDTYVR